LEESKKLADEKVTRRGYAKYAGAGIVVIAVVGVGGYYATRPGPTPTKTVEPTPITTEIGGYKFGLLPRALDYIWWNAFACGALWWLWHRDLGDAEAVDAGYDIKRFNTIMETWARDPEIDAVITATIGAEEAMPGIRALNNAGKVVLLGNNEAGYCPEAVMSCWSGNYQPCYDAGLRIVDLLEDRYGEPKGTVVVDMSDLRSPNLMERNAGYKAACAPHPDIKIVEMQTDEKVDQAATKLGAILKTEHVDAVCSGGQGVNIGFLQALEREKKLFPLDDPEHVIFSGFDGEPTTIRPAVVDGYIDWVIDQPVFAYMAVCAYFGVKYIEAGKDKSALPQLGDDYNVGDLDLKSLVPDFLLKDEYAGQEIWVPDDSWAPAHVEEDSIDNVGHPWVNTQMSLLDDKSILEPALWFNVTDYLKGWGY
jgi:ABC-type sugar transport system substrate-binding protein